MEKIRLFLIDDHRLVVETWALLLNSDPRLEVIGYCCHSDQALAFIRQHKPDIVLTDISMTPLNGFELTSTILDYHPACKIIGVSIHDSGNYVKKMFGAGASGYVSKNSSKEEMIDAIIEVWKGRKYISTDVKDKMVEDSLMKSEFKTLTRKELEIIDLLREGLTSKQIAERECVSSKTVEVHRYNILKKLRLPNIAALINVANLRGL